MITLREELSKLPDTRGRSGRMYALESLILLVLAGFMSGCDSLLAVWRFGQRLSPEQRKSLGFLWHQMPSHPTICIFFHTLDVAALEAVLSRVVLGGHPQDEPLHLAIDGKTLRGSKSGEHPHGVHLLAAFSAALKGVVAQRKAKRGGDEAVAALEILRELPLKNTVLTGDAMFTTRALCELVVEKGGHYVLPVKGNQKALAQAITKAAAEKKTAGNARRNHKSPRQD